MCHSSHRPWQLLFTSLAVQPGSGHQRSNLMTTNSTFKMISKGRYAMSTLKTIGLLSALAMLGFVAAGSAHAERMCYPYADGAPGGYNKITHLCNPLHMVGRDPGPPI